MKDFKNQAISDLKAGKGLIGKDGILTPLIKEFLEAALEGEMSFSMEKYFTPSKKLKCL